MFRLTYIIPRLLVALGLCGFVRCGLDSSLKWLMSCAAESAIGSRVDIQEIITAPASAAGYVKEVRVADPRSPWNNLVEFDQAWLQLDRRALMQRRMVIEHGVITGLEFDTDRTDSGELAKEESESASFELSEEQLAELTRWIDELGSRVGRGVEDQFESVRLARELSERWPREYGVMRDRVRDWRDRVERIEQLAQSARRGDLDQLAEWEDGIRQLQELRRETVQLKEELTRLRQQAAVDKRAIETAKDRDFEQLRELARLRQLKGAELGEYLLGEELSDRVAFWMNGLRRGRRVWSTVMNEPEFNHLAGRGIDVSFDSLKQPSFLVRRLAVRGRASADGAERPFFAQIRDISSNPKAHEHPTQIKLLIPGTPEWRVAAKLDQTGNEPRCIVSASCSNWHLPPRRLGDSDRLAMNVSGGTANVTMQLQLVGDQLTGRLDWQQDAQVTPELADGYGGQYLNEPLQTSMDAINKVAVSVDLSGTLDQPRYKFSSNLGPQLAQGLNTAVSQQLAMWTSRLKQEADARVAEQVAGVERYLQQQQQELMQQMQIGDEQLASIRQLLGDKSQLAERLLSGRLPFNKLF